MIRAALTDLLAGALILAAATSSAAFDLARAVAEAAPGATIRVPAGVHTGTISIGKPLTLIGETGAVIDGGGDGDVMRIEAPDVTLRGLTIRGTGTSLSRSNAGVVVLAPRAVLEQNEIVDVLFGIYLNDAHDSIIRGNRIGGKPLDLQRRGDAIRLWNSHRTLIESNRIEDSRDLVIWYSSAIHVKHNVVSGGRYGLHFMYSHGNTIEGNDLRHNSVGVFLMYSRDLTLRNNVMAYNRGPSGYGVGMKDMDGIQANGNVMVGNRIGLYLDNSPGSMAIRDRWQGNLLAYNDIGIALLPAVRRNDFVGNTFLENIEQVAVLDGSEVVGNSFSLGGHGNFWSDYAGFDLDGDGIGDLPHRPTSLFENLIDRHPKLRLFLYGPATQAIELAARAVPSIRPRPKLVDDSPLVARPPLSTAGIESPGSPLVLGILAAFLLLAPLSLVALGNGRSRALPAGGQPGVAGGPFGAAPPVGQLAPCEPLLAVVGLTKHYGKFKALGDVDFDVCRGESVALWGANGAGKTTVIRCMLGLVGFTGTIRVGGHALVGEGKAVRRLIGYVPQELAFYDDLTAFETSIYFARLKRIDPTRAARVLEDVGLAENRDKRVGELSGGMKQRLALGIALLADPPLLVLDEMTSNLDTSARSAFLALLQRFKARGKTILFISHRLEEVEGLADRVLVLGNGRLLHSCAAVDLAETLGLKTRLRLRVADDAIERARQCLNRLGFDAESHGDGLTVVVSPSRKLAPLEALIADGIAVLDLEIGNHTI